MPGIMLAPRTGVEWFTGVRPWLGRYGRLDRVEDTAIDWFSV
ncbi:hypothetical protein ACFFR3_10620 [Nonomuraea salmonea]|uniref:Uncharacterized protein n=1 Tax=Nonomuraea salmonea TaxID=46181 RepID=A0ABV5NI36_9ACTN